MAKIAMKDIGFPEHYIREKPDKKRIEEFVRIGAALSPEDQIPAKPKLVTWPFPHIHIAKNVLIAGKAVTSKAEKGKGKKDKVKKGYTYELIDGRHRMAALKKFGMKELDANVSNERDPAHRFIQQYQSNATGNLPLDPYARYQAIWTMGHVFSLKQNEIVKATGIAQASISRILAKKQGWKKHGGTRPGAGKKTSNGGQGTGGSLFMPNQYVDRLQVMLGEYKKTRPAILKSFKENLNGTELGSLIEMLRDMAHDLEEKSAE